MPNSFNDELPSGLTRFLWRYLKEKKWCLAGFLLTALIWAGEMSLSPYLLKVIIDSVVQYSGNQEALIHAILVPACVFVSLSIVLNLAFRLYDYISLTLYPDLKAAVTRDMFAYLLNHSYEFFQNHFSGSLARKIFDMGSYIDQLVIIFNEWFYPRFFAMLIASATLFIVVKPVFGIILIVWSCLFVIFSFYAAKKSESLARINSEAAAKMSGTLTDSVTNIMSTKLFSNIPHEIYHVDKDINHLVTTDRNLQWKNLKYNFFQGLSVMVLMGAMLSTLIYGNIHGWVSAGDFAMVIMLSISFMSCVYDIGQQMLKFSKFVGICNQALSFIRIQHEITDNVTAKPINITRGVVEFNNVQFRYENSQPLFENLNISIQSGERVGLVGYSGGGKSTFIKLILRLIDVQNGSIIIDGQDIKTVTQNSLREQIATIPQEPELFHRTIMENIRFAKPNASDDAVINAAKMAGCHDFISELPNQYQSLVGERGIKLSGGQKQRISIARAFLKNAPILILDEATSSLDSVTEQRIKNSLHEIMQGKTTIVIAHRLSTLKDMNRILVFVKGNIVEDGTLDGLLQDKNSHFYKLWQMQAEGFIPSITEVD